MPAELQPIELHDNDGNVVARIVDIRSTNVFVQGYTLALIMDNWRIAMGQKINEINT